MQILITQSIKQALDGIGHVPDNLRQRFDAVTPAPGGYTLTLSEDDATALAELVQWYIKTDPATGKPTAATQPFSDLIGLVDAAMFS
jgi:hypothetical protein